MLTHALEQFAKQGASEILTLSQPVTSTRPEFKGRKASRKWENKCGRHHTTDLAIDVARFLPQLALPLTQLLLRGDFGLKKAHHFLHLVSNLQAAFKLLSTIVTSQMRWDEMGWDPRGRLPLPAVLFLTRGKGFRVPSPSNTTCVPFQFLEPSLT